MTIPLHILLNISGGLTVAGVAIMHVIVCKDVEGAGSALVDGFKLGDYMRWHYPECFALLSKVSFRYQLNLKANYKMRRYTFGVDDDGNITSVHLNNIDRQPMDEESLYQAKKVLSCDADVAVEKMYEATRCLHKLLYSNQFHYKFDLRPGKMLMFNNKRLFHSREQLVRGFRGLCGVFHSEQEWLGKLEKLENDLA